MKKNLLLIVISLFVFTSCSKEDPEPEPISCFTLSTTNADVGEVITSINCSLDAFSFLWNDGEGNQSANKSQSFYYEQPGTYTITLTAFSESKEKQNITTETVTVEQGYGHISFWQSGTPSYGITNVLINDLISVISADYPSGISSCDEVGAANFTLPTGSHEYYATDGDHEWSNTVTILKDECIKLQLQ